MKLKQYRQKKNISQKELAKIIGVSRDTILRAENGQGISRRNARAIAAWSKGVVKAAELMGV
jgi:DNA-binding XRE family transcriptional regulator